MKQIIITAAAIMTLLSCGGQKENKETNEKYVSRTDAGVGRRVSSDCARLSIFRTDGVAQP